MPFRSNPEAKLQDRIVAFLEARGWLVEETHGNVFQKGLPDLFCFHPELDLYRWVDVKIEKNHKYTKDQCQKWTAWEEKGLGVWIMMGDTDEWYAKLFEPPNFRQYWKNRYDRYLQTNEEILSEEFPDAGPYDDFC